MNTTYEGDALARRMFAADHPSKDFDSSPSDLKRKYERKALDRLADDKPSSDE